MADFELLHTVQRSLSLQARNQSRDQERPSQAIRKKKSGDYGGFNDDISSDVPSSRAIQQKESGAYGFDDDISSDVPSSRAIQQKDSGKYGFDDGFSEENHSIQGDGLELALRNSGSEPVTASRVASITVDLNHTNHYVPVEIESAHAPSPASRGKDFTPAINRTMPTLDVASISESLPATAQDSSHPDSQENPHLAWLHDNMSKDKARELLRSTKNSNGEVDDGTFLVYARNNTDDSHVLAVMFRGKPTFHLVDRSKGVWTINRKSFGQKADIVEFIEQFYNPVRGWPVLLRPPVYKYNSTNSTWIMNDTLDLEVLPAANTALNRTEAQRKSLSSIPIWLHGPISKDDAENLVRSTTDIDGFVKTGTFLVREIPDCRDTYALCVWYNTRALHHLVYRGDDGMWNINKLAIGNKTDFVQFIEQFCIKPTLHFLFTIPVVDFASTYDSESSAHLDPLSSSENVLLKKSFGSSTPWLHGPSTLSDDRFESLIRSKTNSDGIVVPGTFLVRTVSDRDNTFVLFLWFRNKVTRHRITKSEHGVWTINNKAWGNKTDLVQFVEQFYYSVDGLPARFRTPVSSSLLPGVVDEVPVINAPSVSLESQGGSLADVPIWLHGPITKGEAEDILRRGIVKTQEVNQSVPFLVRRVAANGGHNYVLSVFSNISTHHPINKRKDGVWTMNGKAWGKHTDFIKFIEQFYDEVSGWPVRLTTPIANPNPKYVRIELPGPHWGRLGTLMDDNDSIELHNSETTVPLWFQLKDLLSKSSTSLARLSQLRILDSIVPFCDTSRKRIVFFHPLESKWMDAIIVKQHHQQFKFTLEVPVEGDSHKLARAFEARFKQYCKALYESTQHVRDGLTGRLQDVDSDIVNINLKNISQTSTIKKSFFPFPVPKDQRANVFDESKYVNGHFFIVTRPETSTSNNEYVLMIKYKDKATHHLLKRNEEGYWQMNRKSYGYENCSLLSSYVEYLYSEEPSKHSYPSSARLHDGGPESGAFNIGFHEDMLHVSNVVALVDVLGRPSSITVGEGCSSMAVLIKAAAGTGKTWLTYQAVHLLSKPGSHFVPLLIPLSKLASMWRTQNIPMPDDLVEWYLYQIYGPQGTEKNFDQLCLLIDAYRSLRMIVIIDGIDEAIDFFSLADDFIFNKLTTGGRRCLLTSRPEALQTNDNIKWMKFVIFDLLPYSEEQQRNVLQCQLNTPARRFVHAVNNFSAARDEMDRLYKKACDESDYVELECIDELDLILLNASSKTGKIAQRRYRYNPELSQVIKRGSEVMPVSSLQELRAVSDKSVVVFAAAMTEVANSLGTQLLRSKEEALESSGIVVLLAPNKGDDRIERKATLKYQYEVQTGVRPGSKYAWVFDVVRSTVVVDSLADMPKVQEALESARLSVVRIKNFYAHLDPTHFRRLAFIVKCNLPGGMHHLCEVQVIHRPVFTLRVTRKDLMHEPYELFRELFGKEINSSLGSSDGWMQLTDRISQWRSFTKEPVLMSLLITVLNSIDFKHPDIQKLPKNRAELYLQAVEIITLSKLGTTSLQSSISSNKNRLNDTTVAPNLTSGLKRLCYHNHFWGLDGRRVFSTTDVHQVLRDEERSAFDACVDQDAADDYRVPTMKVLDQQSIEGNAVTMFQTAHLSLQEFRAALTFAEQLHTEEHDQDMIKSLIDKPTKVKSMFDLGRHKVMLEFAAEMGAGNKLFNQVAGMSDGHLDLSGLQKGGADVVSYYLQRTSSLGHLVTTINLSQSQVGDEGAVKLMELLVWSPVQTLDLSQCYLGYESGVALGKYLRHKNCSLLKVVAPNNNFSDEGMHEIATGLAHNTITTEVDFGMNCTTVGTVAVLKALQSNTCLRKANLTTTLQYATSADAAVLESTCAANKTVKFLTLNWVVRDERTHQSLCKMWKKRAKSFFLPHPTAVIQVLKCTPDLCGYFSRGDVVREYTPEEMFSSSKEELAKYYEKPDPGRLIRHEFLGVSERGLPVSISVRDIKTEHQKNPSQLEVMHCWVISLKNGKEYYRQNPGGALCASKMPESGQWGLLQYAEDDDKNEDEAKIESVEIQIVRAAAE